MAVKIGIVSPMTAILPMIGEAFEAAWPQAKCINLVDEALYAAFAETGEALSPHIVARLSRLFELSAESGARAIAFTGSAFGEAVRRARKNVDLEVLTSFEAMIGDALALGERIHVLTTAQVSLDLIAQELKEAAAANGRKFDLTGAVVGGAFEALHDARDGDRHDRLIVEAIAAAPPADVVMVGQYSMGRAARLAGAAGKPVLSPGLSMAKAMRRRFEGDA